MGDRTSTATIFVFLVTFLGVFAVLVNSMPAELYGPTLKETKTRGEWFPEEDIGFLNYTDSGNLTRGYHTDLELGDVNVVVWWAYYPYNDITIYHTWQVLWWWDRHSLDDMPLTLTDLEAHSPHEGIANQSHMVLTCPCQKSYYVYFIYNSTTYANWAEAMTGGELELYMGMGWNDGIEQQNAWSLIWNIMTFQAPEVFGTGASASVMNAIIAIPLWASFAIIGAIMILWFIPFLGGE